MHRAVGYIRVSTEDQALEGVSLAAQRNKVLAWSDLNDHELLAIEEDAGISGATADKRPGLQAALDTACRTKATLVVYSAGDADTDMRREIADRLARNWGQMK